MTPAAVNAIWDAFEKWNDVTCLCDAAPFWYVDVFDDPLAYPPMLRVWQEYIEELNAAVFQAREAIRLLGRGS